MEKTIAAISTAPAPGGIGIVRLSGREAFSIGEKVFRGVSGRALSLSLIHISEPTRH